MMVMQLVLISVLSVQGRVEHQKHFGWFFRVLLDSPEKVVSAKADKIDDFILTLLIM